MAACALQAEAEIDHAILLCVVMIFRCDDFAGFSQIHIEAVAVAGEAQPIVKGMRVFEARVR